jgi:flagellar motor switch protein FliN
MSDTPTDQQSPAPGGTAATPQSAPAGTAQPGGTAKNTSDIESLLDETEAAMSQAQLDESLASSPLPTGQPPSEAKSAEASDSPQPYQFGDLKGLASDEPPHSLDLLGDVELDLRIELGRTLMRLEDVLRLRGGSVVALDKLAGDPVDIYINGRLIARGEVLVMNDNFCIRVTELVGSGSKNV